MQLLGFYEVVPIYISGGKAMGDVFAGCSFALESENEKWGSASAPNSRHLLRAPESLIRGIYGEQG